MAWRTNISVTVASAVISTIAVSILGNALDWFKDVFAADVASGVVIASTVECDELDNGSADWEIFREATGRVIVGSGSGSDFLAAYRNDATGEPLRAKGPFAVGGQERVTLTIDEMPKHDHDLQVRSFETQHGGGQERGRWHEGPSGDRTLAAGGSQPHENMPPFIALYFCKKVS